MNDRQRLEKIERAFSKPTGDRLLDDLVQMTPKASSHFQHQLEDQLIRRLNAKSHPQQTEDKNMATIPRNLPAQRSQPTRGWVTAAALLLVLGGIFAVFMNLNPESVAIILSTGADATPSPQITTPTPEQRQAIIARQEIPRGTLISTELVTVVTVHSLSAHELPPDTFSTVTDVENLIAARDIAPGEYIVPDLVTSDAVVWSDGSPWQISMFLRLMRETPEIDSLMRNNQPLLALIPLNSAYIALPLHFRNALDNNESLRAVFLREHIIEIEDLHSSVSMNLNFTTHSIHSVAGGGLVQVVDCVLPMYGVGCDPGQPILNRDDLQTRLPWEPTTTTFVPLPESYDDVLALGFSALSDGERIPVRLSMSYCALHPDSETCDENIDQIGNTQDELVVLSYGMITSSFVTDTDRPFIAMPDLTTMMTVLWAFKEDVPVIIERVEDAAENAAPSTAASPITITLPVDDPMITVAADIQAGMLVNITVRMLFVDMDEEFQQPVTDGDQIMELLADLQLTESRIITDARVISLGDAEIVLEITENGAAVGWIVEVGLPLNITPVDTP